MIELKNFNRIANDLGGAESLFEREATAAARALGPQVVTNVRKHTPQSSGDLANAIEDTVESNSDSVTLRVNAGSVPAVVVASVEAGSRPHWPPWGPGSALAAWANRKGIPPFLVARAIARRGTIKRFGYDGARMFRRGLADSERAIEKAMQDLEKALVKGLF